MPNHCSNVMTIVGDPDTVSAFVEKVNGPGPNYPEQWGDNKGKRKDPADLKVSVLSFHQTVPIPEEAQVAGYSEAGYDAEHSLWGVKWGAYDESLERHEPNNAKYRFDTAWSPPHVWLLATSIMFPKLTFFLSYSEESPSRGRMTIRNGEMLDETYDSFPFTEQYPEYDESRENEPGYENDYYEQTNKISNKYVIAHDYWVAEESEKLL